MSAPARSPAVIACSGPALTTLGEDAARRITRFYAPVIAGTAFTMGPTRTVALSGLGRPLFPHCTAIVSTRFSGQRAHDPRGPGPDQAPVGTGGARRRRLIPAGRPEEGGRTRSGAPPSGVPRVPGGQPGTRPSVLTI